MFRNIETELTDGQAESLEAEEFFVGMFGGYGSGKTHGLCLKLLQLASLNRGIPGGIVCPTIKMFRRDVYPLLEQVCGEHGVRFYYRAGAAEIELPDTENKIYVFHGEDDGRSIKGPNLGYMLLNEMTLLSWNTFKSAIGRVRLKNAPFPQVYGSGTPEDFNWAYDAFIDKPLKNSKVIYADTRQNTFTADWYVDMLLSSYDEIARQQYVEGKFVPTSGRAALHQFNRAKHVSKEALLPPEQVEQIWATIDFNYFPMAATIWQYNPTLAIPLRAKECISIPKADTWELARALQQRIGYGWEKAVLFPDGIGGSQHRTTGRAGVTDIEILRDHGFTDIRFKRRLSVRDCLNAGNNLLAKNKILVHPDCEEFIRDAERCKIKEGIYEIDKSDPLRSHWLDGFKNMADYMFPCAKPYTEITNRKRM